MCILRYYGENDAQRSLVLGLVFKAVDLWKSAKYKDATPSLKENYVFWNP